MSNNRERGRASLGRAGMWAGVFVMAIGVASFVAEQAFATPIYLQVIGISGKIVGESKEPAHMNWIAVSSVSSGDLAEEAKADAAIGSQSSGAGAGKAKADAAATRDAGSGMTTGRRAHKPFVIVREVDKASPLLMKACASGEHLKEVDIDDVSNGKTVHYVLSDVVISSVNKAGGGDRPTESVTFNYTKIEMK